MKISKKKRHHWLIGVTGVLSLVLITSLVTQSSDLQGRLTNSNNLGTLQSAMADTCGSSVSSDTVFIKTPYALGRNTPDGTYDYPYKTISDLQTHLDNNSSIERVCMSGNFSGELDLSNQSGSVEIKEYNNTSSSFTHSGSNDSLLEASSGLDITIMEIDFEGQIELDDIGAFSIYGSTLQTSGTYSVLKVTNSDSVYLEDVSMSGGTDSNLNVSSLDSVDIINSDFTDAGDENINISSIDTLTIENSTFGEAKNNNLTLNTISQTTIDSITLSDAEDYGISATAVDTLEIDGITSSFLNNGVQHIDGANLSINNANFDTENIGVKTYEVQNIELNDISIDTGEIGIDILNNTNTSISNSQLTNLRDGITILNFDSADISNNNFENLINIPVTLKNGSSFTFNENTMIDYFGKIGFYAELISGTCEMEKNQISGTDDEDDVDFGVDIECGSAIINNNFISRHRYALKVTTNTSEIYHNSIAYHEHTAIYLADQNSATSKSHDIQNNILYSNTYAFTYGGDISDLNSDYNMFDGTITTTTGFGDELTLSEWQSENGYDSHSSEDNPIFSHSLSGATLTEDDLHIDSTSPAIDAGIDTLGIIEDIDGEVRILFNNTPDIGADEYYSAN
jgi:hypothetical protein